MTNSKFDRYRILYDRGHVVAARPIFRMIVIVMGIISGLSIGGGIVAIIWNAISPTQFNLFGVTFSTSHVGVAFTALGLITMLFVIREVLKHMHMLASLPSDNSERYTEIYSDEINAIDEEDAPNPTIIRLNMIVQEAITDSTVRKFYRLPYYQSNEIIEAGQAIRKYFGDYLGELTYYLREMDSENISEAMKLIDIFLSKTWMNHLLDSSIDTYIIKDYLIELNILFVSKGISSKRLTQERMNQLSHNWEQISQNTYKDHLNCFALETVISSLPKMISPKTRPSKLGS